MYFIQNNGDGKILAKATVKSVINSDKMAEEQSVALIKQHEQQLNLSAEQTKRWAGKKYLCLVEIANPVQIEPLLLNRQKNMDDWITVNSIDEIVNAENAENPKYISVRLTKTH